MIEPGSGNLLEAPVEALVNPVNTEGVMGKGLALQFKRAYPDVFKAYAKACRGRLVEIGKMHVVDRGLQRPRWIFNFPTKSHWRQPSRLEYIERGLQDLTAQVKAHGVRSIAVPPLGCGNGGLSWREVEPVIRQAFEQLSNVKVLLFAPGDAPTPAATVNATPRPDMTPGRAAFLAALARYQVPGYDYGLTLLEAQKVAYFLTVVGELGSLEFTAHHYGPFAPRLGNVLERLEGHFLRGWTGDGKPDAQLELLPGAEAAALSFLTDRTENLARLDRVARLIETFETPFGMELLATVHWVAVRAQASDLATVIDGVHNWSDRKRDTMNPGHIQAAWNRLVEQHWLEPPLLTP